MTKSFQFSTFNFQLFSASLLVLLAGMLVVIPLARASAVDPTQQVCDDARGKLSRGEITELPKVCQDAEHANEGNPIYETLGVAANLLSLVGGVVAVIAIIIGGLKLITSSGDSNSVASARRTILYALLSVGIIAMAQVIVRFILVKLPL